MQMKGTAMRLNFSQCLLSALTAQILTLTAAAATEQSAADITITTDHIEAYFSSALTSNEASSESESDSTSEILRRALAAEAAIATYDEALGIPKCGLESSSCDTGDLVIGRGNVYPEPNHPNTLNSLACFDGTSGGSSDESVDRIVVSSESGGYLMEERRALITATVNCWADGYVNDYVYFYYTNIQSTNADWNFIERIQCTGGGQQTVSTSYTLPQGLDHAVRVSIRHVENDALVSTTDSCGLGSFTDNDDVAFTVAAYRPSPTSGPTPAPSPSPSTPNPTRAESFLGNNLIDVPELGIRLDSSLTATQLAKVGQRVQFNGGNLSAIRWHSWMDGAGAFALSNGHHVYVSNSEEDDGKGGVYGLYFDTDGKPYDYKQLLSSTTWNCSGGKTPWNTWISCEEHSAGQCWEIDPDPFSVNHQTPQKTVLGGDGGSFEAVAVQDSKDKDGPTFFVTEDRSNGALRRVQTTCRGWDALKVGGCPTTTTYLRFLNNQRFEWTTDKSLGRQSASRNYPNTEGITYRDGKLYFISKVWYYMYTLDLDSMTWSSERTGRKLVGEGSFLGQPDGVISGFNQRYMYFTEEDNKGNGMYARDEFGTYKTVFQAMSGQYVGDETVGLAVSPDGKTMYAGYQEAGVLFALKRKDDEVWDR